ncbi:MAG TPA: MerR family transcriptional regulator [Aggregatilineales bacterium]|jgi:DNA-binding transcriptional MerR regulator|nr:MerR family transcriptional regulator [Aggregatilineales bacterium]
MYTVKQVAELAGVSVRTLHYYDEIGLLTPSEVRPNGYRYYDDDALLRLQQILFYREIGFELQQIKDVLDRADFDRVAALRAHRSVLQEKMGRLADLVDTIDNTIKHLTGETIMSDKKRLFKAFSDEQSKEYEREARLQYDPQIVNDSIKRWNGYSPQQRTAIADEGNQIYTAIVEAIEAGLSPQHEDVQALMVRWHEHLRYFYEPTLEILRGLGMTYATNPDFIANFIKLHPDLPEFMGAAVEQYVDDLETAEITRMLDDDNLNSAARRLS